MKNLIIWLAIFSSFVDLFAGPARLKDIANIRGVRPNQLIGYGLVVGLSKTGDTAAALMTNEATKKLMASLGMKVEKQSLVLGSIASVIVTADLRPFSRNGDLLNVRVSAVGDAASLQGGTLLVTPLRAGDGQIYAIAQGSVSVGQASGSGNEVWTNAYISNGAIVEKEFLPQFLEDGKFVISLKNPDFTTNVRVVKKINKYFRGFYASSKNLSTISIQIPENYLKDPIKFISMVESLTVETDLKSKIVINEKTGTVVLGGQISIQNVAISHGELAITVKENDEATQEEIARDESLVEMNAVNISDLVQSLNTLGVKPSDLMEILKAMHRANAIHAEIDVL